MLPLGEDGTGGADKVGGGSSLLRGGTRRKEYAAGGGRVDAKSSPFLMVLKFRMSEIQRFSSIAWSAYGFNNPTLSDSSNRNNCMFCAIKFLLLRITLFDFLL